MFYKTLLEYGFLGILGGSIYYMIEMLFRGFSHISMFILGGICMMFFAYVYCLNNASPTGMEFSL